MPELCCLEGIDQVLETPVIRSGRQGGTSDTHPCVDVQVIGPSTAYTLSRVHSASPPPDLYASGVRILGDVGVSENHRETAFNIQNPSMPANLPATLSVVLLI